MSDQFWTGIILAAVAGAILAVGFLRREMPINVRIDARRDASPVAFWSLVIFHTFLVVVGLIVAARAI